MKTKNDYLNDADFREVALTAYKHQTGIGVNATHRVGNYTAKQFPCTYPDFKFKTINVYVKDSIFLLAQIQLNMTDKVLIPSRNHAGDPEARAALEEIFLQEGFKVKE